MARVKPLLVLAVAALHLAVVAGRIRANELMPDIQLSSRLFKQRWQVALAVGKSIGELEAVVRLDALHFYATACIQAVRLRRKSAEE